eukprot:scaffold175371_cov16-Tisochrysis_lutea.AAC.1
MAWSRPSCLYWLQCAQCSRGLRAAAGKPLLSRPITFTGLHSNLVEMTMFHAQKIRLSTTTQGEEEEEEEENLAQQGAARKYNGNVPEG